MEGIVPGLEMSARDRTLLLEENLVTSFVPEAAGNATAQPEDPEDGQGAGQWGL